MIDVVQQFWHLIVPVLNGIVACFASGHVVLTKRDPRAAVGWVGVIWLAPFIGSLLYFFFGINRIHRKAVRLRSTAPIHRTPRFELRGNTFAYEADNRCQHLAPLTKLGRRVTGRELLDGNRVTLLQNGDEAFPAMIDAIDRAEATITMSTYIFDNDRAGRAFADRLKSAAARGVDVRVLIDDVGSRYSWPSGDRLLGHSDVKVARFLPTMTPWHWQYSNLRNHRKSLVIDGTTAFTGGMNIREGNYLNQPGRSPIQDLHFCFRGPVVHQIQEVFVVDWCFVTGEELTGEQWFGSVQNEGSLLARAISDGPDVELDQLEHVILGAITVAERSITVATPYFLPNQSLVSALNIAALRDVAVNILVPSKSNLRTVQWASLATIPQLLDSGCQIWASPPPFDHSKLMVVDQQWSLVGSANWDQRSLRLNFELDVECYDAELAKRLDMMATDRMAKSMRLTKDFFQQMPLWKRLRNGLAHLASPYL